MMRRLACLRGLLPRSGSVSSAVLRVFLVSTFCSLAVIAMTDFLDEQPERPAGWLEPLSRLLNAALATFNGGPELSYDRARSLQLYRLLLTLCLAVAICFFIGSRNRWKSWGAALRRVYVDSGCLHGRELGKAIMFGYAQMILGLLGAICLLVWDDYKFGNSEEVMYAEQWTYLRISIVTSLAFAFACYAAAFRTCSRA
jgi:hypothetical protein